MLTNSVLVVGRPGPEPWGPADVRPAADVRPDRAAPPGDNRVNVGSPCGTVL